MKVFQNMVIAVIMICALTVASPVAAEVLEKDANPVKMVLTEWGGVVLEQQGQERYFKIWNKADGTFNNLAIEKTNIQSFDAYENRIVYIRNRGSYSEVHIYDIEAKTTSRVDNTYAIKKNIKMHGDYVVWEEYSGGKANLILHKLTSGEQKKFEGNYADQIEPALSATHLVWIDYSGGHKVIKGYNLNSQEALTIRDNVSDKQSLNIFGQKIIWAEIREGTGGTRVASANSYFEELWGSKLTNISIYDIWMHDIEQNKTTRLTDSSVNQVQPVLSDQYDAWLQTSGGNPDLYLLNLNTMKVTPMAVSDAYEVQPAIGYGYIAWIAMRGNMADLNVQDLSPAPSAKADIKLMVNGSEYYSDPKPYIKNDRVLVPMRRIFEILGWEITWDDATRTVTGNKGLSTIQLTVGSMTAYRNGEAFTMDVEPEIHAASGRTMVPIRFVTEATGGYTVEWNDITRTVVIRSGI
ncbi:MAG: hypothetical protein GX550_07650 [Syntrophomonadaceae bacterium]|nr:hypothetical protein [Syntrophomonadaceae bacterium]